MLEQLFIEAVRKIVIEEIEKATKDLPLMVRDIIQDDNLENKASTQTRTDEELTEFIVSAVRNECDIEEFIDERIENALDNSEFIKHDVLEDAISEKLEYASIKIRF